MCELLPFDDGWLPVDDEPLLFEPDADAEPPLPDPPDDEPLLDPPFEPPDEDEDGPPLPDEPDEPDEPDDDDDDEPEPDPTAAPPDLLLCEE